MDKFDRVFDRDDVLALVHIDLVEHRRQGRRFTAAGGAGDENEPLFSFDQLFVNLRGVQIVEAGNLDGNDPKSRGHVAHGTVIVDPETAHFGNLYRKVEFVVLFELLLLLFGDDGVADRFDRFTVEFGEIERTQLAVDTDLRFAAADEMEVAGVVGDDVFEQFTDVDGGLTHGGSLRHKKAPTGASGHSMTAGTTK